MELSDAGRPTAFDDWRMHSLKEVERWLDRWPIYLPPDDADAIVGDDPADGRPDGE